MKKLGLIMLAVLALGRVHAQKDSTEFGEIVMISAEADSAFTQARELAYEGEYQTSRKILNLLLLEDPGNYQYRLFQARTYVWDKKHQSARNLIRNLIVEDTNAYAIYELRVQNEKIAKEHPITIRYCDDGINRFPDNNEFFHVSKVQSMVTTNDYREAVMAVDTAIAAYPDNTQLKQLKTFLLNQLIIDGLAIGGSMEYFTKSYRPWFFGFVQYGRQTPIGAVIGRVNFGERNQDFASLGVQGEVDIYPRFTARSYGYINVGYSPSQIFPSFKVGVEYTSMLGKSDFEASLGFRYLDFLVNQVTMYTGSIGYYWGNEYASIRPFVIFDKNGFGTTWNFLYRKFFTGKGDFVQFTAGYGLVPDERIFQLTNGLEIENYRLDNQYIGFGYQKLVNSGLYTRFDLIFTRQENFGQQNDYFGIVTIGLTLGFRL